ncbi:protein-L-isoaspartate(D-aspartate) O-methyltransferase [Halalkalicoccus jeotgali]|uniref:Protein-L-isoaspartate O-methyltransferase n=1 Tax=Halalkalicoccus jeotgali (strain DSM 18796 / CECT 7217 / JCM 14584 / KCTC 4019 / B3) TaxID=795797 RepID=D8J917_HALJB|nr:protein-L-isoaspartate(D-aspartate) O-methyltransferase [Halalkalicoccus jeotgali]ADJ16286.1 protein-L-isoaspartate O-methyltransferase [Halalkalicoccus jeotgali B3]ELY37020.1 protein-L-isoaspartate O-methyltransferase [Halalkalicoccus jeotgali B3]
MYEDEREALADRLARCEGLSEATVAAMKAVPRHVFVPEPRRNDAYADRPLPIGDGQTISAPHMVAIMTELLDVESGDRVLEIGTGCGYHAAVTAEVVGAESVFSVEFSPDLADNARRTLERIGYGEISIRQGDGREGWPEGAPYDAAYLTCAVPEIPAPVLEQVRDGGTIVAPVGTDGQRLVRARVGPDGIAARTTHGAVRFVTVRT